MKSATPLPSTHCSELALLNSLCSPKGITEPSQSLNNGPHYFLLKKYNLYRSRGISNDHITASQWLFVDTVIIHHL